MIGKAQITRAFWLCTALTIATGLVFTLFPGIDLWASGQFYDGKGFQAARDASLQDIRNAAWWLSIIFCLLAAFMTLATSLRKASTQRIPTRVWGFVFSVYLAAPIAMANLVFKEYWGRARPRSVEAFGGDRQFTSPLEFTDQCLRNCSFVSGEASGIVATALVLSLVVAPAMTRGKTVFLGIVWVLAAWIAGLRIAMGGHFLSDVLFGALFTALIACLLFRVFRLYETPATVTPGNVAKDMRDLFRRRRS